MTDNIRQRSESQCDDVTESDPESDSGDLDHVTDDNVAPSKLGVVSALQRVSTKQSPYFKAFYKHFPLQLTVNTGAEAMTLLRQKID
jgi:hypothetical protein